MVTLTFVFNKEKLASADRTEEELLQPMREHAAKYGINEIKHGVFAKDGERALAALIKFIPQITTKDKEYISFLDEWTLNVGGEKEDCIQEAQKWLNIHEG